MVDTVTTTTTTTTTTMGNDNDDWEVAVDTGEFDKRLEQQEKARAANQEPTISAVSSNVNDDDSRTSSSINFMNSNKPIRILKRPISQCQLPTNNDVTNSLISTTTTSIAASNNNNNTNNSNSPVSTTTSSSTTVPVVSIIPRNPNKDSTNSSQSITTPVFSSPSLSSQTTKPAIKTYEQRELEYRLARLRIMGEEESSVKDDDIPVVETTSVPTDDTTKPTTSSSSTTSSTIRTTNKMSGLSQQPLQCHSTPGSYAANLYSLTNIPSNTGTIHFTPNTTTNNTNNNNSTPNLGTGPYSSPNFPQHYHGAYSTPYSHMPPPPLIPRYPLAATTTTTLYMTSTAPFVSAPSSSSSSSVSSSYHLTSQQHSNMTTTNWYHYQNPQTPYGTQQYGHPQ
ncbi:unnamed protein product [Rotaria sp. Silwood1]|nr:unnamed protein product [Rotaria sp. Silwood1]CAF4576276.1 unnamed protein product [Rotaria sp. Silwood1]